MRTQPQSKTEQFKEMVRNPYCWPGGYEKVALMDDGGTICHKCAKEEARNILDSTIKGIGDGWNFQAVFVNWEDTDLFCDHCGNRIPSEYAE